MSACNWCGYNADYIKERSKQMEDKLCGACLNAYEQDLSYEDLLNGKKYDETEENSDGTNE
jgi:hypothetical protein